MSPSHDIKPIGNRNTSQQPGVNTRVNTRNWLISFFLFVAVFLFFLYYFSEISKEYKLLQKVYPFWLIAAIFFQCMTYWLAARVYRFLFDALKPLQPFRRPGPGAFLKASLIASVLNQTIPGAQLSGNAFFFNFFSRFHLPAEQIIVLLLSELLIYYASMVLIIIVLLISCFFFFRSFLSFKSTLAAGLIIYLVFGIIVALAGKMHLIERLYARTQKINWLKKLGSHLASRFPPHTTPPGDMQWIKFFRNNKTTTSKVLFCQFFIFISDMATLYVLLLGIGYHPSPLVIALAFICTRIVTLVPFLPGSLILYEGSMSLFLTNAGIPAGTAVIATLVYRLLSFWLPIPIGALLYKKWIARPDE